MAYSPLPRARDERNESAIGSRSDKQSPPHSYDSNPPLIATDHTYWNKPHMVDLFFNYVSRGEMRVADLITHRFSPRDALEAYRVLREERMTAMGVLFDWTQL